MASPTTTPRPTNDFIEANAAAQPVLEDMVENVTEITFSGSLVAMTALKPTFSLPASDLANGRVVIDRIEGNELSSWFFGTGSDGGLASAMLVMWKRLRHKRPSPLYAAASAEPLMWIPRVLGVFDLTLGATTGADHASGAPGLVASTHRLVDTISKAANGDRTLSVGGLRIGGPAAADNGLMIVNADSEGGCLFEWHLACGASCTGINVVTRGFSRAW